MPEQALPEHGEDARIAASVPSFLEHELSDLKRQIQEAREDGALYAGYPDQYAVLHKEDVAFLKTDFDAAEYVYENTTDRDSASVVSLDHLEKAIDRQIEVQQQIEQHFPSGRNRGAASDLEIEM